MSDFLVLIFGSLGELSSYSQWVWLRPKALLLLLLIPLFALRPLRSRVTIEHGAPWLFRNTLRYRVIEGVLRHGSLFIGISVLTLLVLALGGPARNIQKSEPNQNRPALVYIMDVSGSMNGILWERLMGFLKSFMKRADTLQDEKRIGVGIYYFSSSPLLNVSPTSSYRLLHGVVARFTTGSYGAGSGTEPAPSMWLSILDLARMSDATLAAKLQQLRREMLFSCTPRGLRDSPEDFARRFVQVHGVLALDSLRKAMLGKRMVIGTDTDFDLSSSGDLCPWRLFRFSAAIGLPIDVVSSGPMVSTVVDDMPSLIAITGGNFYPLSSSFTNNSSVLAKEDHEHIEVAVKTIYQSLTTTGLWKQYTSQTILDTRPQRSILALTLVLSFVWISIRFLRPMIGW